MHVVSLLSQKGGAGKTTLAVNVAVACHLAGLTTAILDIDPQASATSWADLRESDEPLAIAIPHSRLGKALDTAVANDCDLAIVDSAPFNSEATITAAKASDLVLIPCRASILDLTAIRSTLDLCGLSKARLGVVINGVKSKSLELEAKRALQEIIDPSQIVPVTICDRINFVRSLSNGLGVLEHSPEDKAASEITRLFNWLIKELANE